MRHIVKDTPPSDVTTTLQATTTNLASSTAARAAFDQLDKETVRGALATEQKHLCAYCMCRIRPETTDEQGRPKMRISHRIPIKVEPRAALTWSNLLGSCDGGIAGTCDVAQGDAKIAVDPTRVESVALVRYERRPPREGLFITSDDPAVRLDVEGTLRLNAGYLP